MNYRLNYEIGNYVTVKGQNITVIEEITKEFLSLKDKDGIEIKMLYKDVYPIELTPDILKQSAVKIFRTTPYILHNEILYEIPTSNNFVYLRQVEYKDVSMWMISQIKFKYFHDIQNYLKLLNIDNKLNLFK